MTQVFISHSSNDSQFARQLVDQLSAAGVPIWIAPDSIEPGEEWVDAIERGLNTSTHLVLLISPTAITSRWVKLEMSAGIRLAVEGRLRIIPVNYCPCQGVPLFWGEFQWLEYGGDPDRLAGDLLNLIRGRRKTIGVATPAMGAGELEQLLGQAVTRYLGRVSPRTRRTYASHLSRFMKWRESYKKPPRTLSGQIVEYTAYLQEQGLTPGTIQAYVNTVRRMLHIAAELDPRLAVISSQDQFAV